MQCRAHQRKIHTIDELKQRLIEVWRGLEQSTVDIAIDQWRKRLRACVRAKGGHTFFVMFYLNFALLSKTALLLRFTFTLVLVLQGNVATKLSYCGKFFILLKSYFFLIPTLKEFKKSTNICQSYSKNESGPVFDQQCKLYIFVILFVRACSVWSVGWWQWQYGACRLLRFLKARDWNVEDAKKQLKETVEWRRVLNPLNVDCRWCHDSPGYHGVVRTFIIYTSAILSISLSFHP